MLASETFHRQKRNPKMSIFTRKAGYVGVAAVTFALLAGSEATGALAQEAELQFTTAPVEASDLPAMPSTEGSGVQFVTDPVVQVASDEAIAADKAANEAAKAAAEAEAELEITRPDAASLDAMVGKIPATASLNTQMRCLASAVYFESRGEPLAGQLAVAKVIMNRAKSSSFPNSYCSVVKQRSQFSFVRGGRIPTPNKNSNAWKRAKAIAIIADQDLWQSEARDSLYFHANYVSPSWARAKSKRARINTHIFYR